MLAIKQIESRPRIQGAPAGIHARVSEGCSTCGLERYGVTKQLSKPLKEMPQTALDVQYINVQSASGKVDAKDLTKVRAHVIRNSYRNRRNEAMRPGPQREIRPKMMCMCGHRQTSGQVINTIHQIQSILGAGRCDPFLHLQTESVPKGYHELVDYSVTTVWSKIRSPEFAFAYAQDWLNRAAQNPTVLHTVLFTASCHLESLRGAETISGSKKKSRLEQLRQKGEAISCVLNTLRNENYLESDELIQSMLFLAMNETKDKEDPPDWSPFLAPLRSLQWLNIYGTRTYYMPHVVAVQEIIKKRGGIRNIHTIGVSWHISCSELISCAATLDRPQHPLLDPFGRDIEYFPSSTSSNIPKPTHDSDTIAYGLSYLQASGLYRDFIDVFLKMRDYSETVKLYENSSKPPEFLADNRNWVLYHLLSLPSASELLCQDGLLLKDSDRTMKCYEACRIAALMYCIHVVFPTPRSLQARKNLLPRMKEVIEGIDLLMASKEMVELVLWCVVIGGIAATGQNERPWFLIQQNILSTILRLTKWSEVKDVMKRFAWVDSACDPGGEAFFNEIG